MCGEGAPVLWGYWRALQSNHHSEILNPHFQIIRNQKPCLDPPTGLPRSAACIQTWQKTEAFEAPPGFADTATPPRLVARRCLETREGSFNAGGSTSPAVCGIIACSKSCNQDKLLWRRCQAPSILPKQVSQSHAQGAIVS